MTQMVQTEVISKTRHMTGTVDGPNTILSITNEHQLEIEMNTVLSEQTLTITDALESISIKLSNHELLRLSEFIQMHLANIKKS